MKNITTFIILFTNIIHCQGSPSKLKQLKTKANMMLEQVKVFTESKAGVSSTFVPRSEFLYPGLNQAKIKKIKQLWADYYECQRALYESRQTFVVPKALAFLEGSNVVLECEVCESPRDLFLKIKWFYGEDFNMDHINEIKDKDKILVRNDNLYIYNIRLESGGMYVCKKGTHSARPYIVHVFNEEKTKMVVPVGNPYNTHPAPDVHIKEVNLTVTTQWSDWSECSRCDRVGIRYRHGICTLIANQNLQEGDSKPESKPKSEQSAKNKTENLINKDNSKHNASFAPFFAHKNFTGVKENLLQNISFKDDLEILDIFEEGIPCRSKLISKNIQRLVENRSSEVMAGYCKVKCKKGTFFVVKDDKGKVLETANNSAGIYSVLQGMPDVMPVILRTMKFAQYKQYFKISCPGYRGKNIPVQWYTGKTALTNKLFQEETKGRVRIDEYNQIVFNPILLGDARVYTCWVREDLVGTVRVRVEKDESWETESWIRITGTVTIFLVFTWVYYNVFKYS